MDGCDSGVDRCNQGGKWTFWGHDLCREEACYSLILGCVWNLDVVVRSRKWSFFSTPKRPFWVCIVRLYFSGGILLNPLPHCY